MAHPLICPVSRSVGIRTVAISPHSLKNSVKPLRICTTPSFTSWHTSWDSDILVYQIDPWKLGNILRLWNNITTAKTYVILIIILVEALNESSFSGACPRCPSIWPATSLMTSDPLIISCYPAFWWTQPIDPASFSANLVIRPAIFQVMSSERFPLKYLVQNQTYTDAPRSLARSMKRSLPSKVSPLFSTACIAQNIIKGKYGNMLTWGQHTPRCKSKGEIWSIMSISPSLLLPQSQIQYAHNL